MAGEIKTPLNVDVQMAKRAIWWDDEVDNNLANLWPYDNDPSRFRGTKVQLSEIRGAMKRYEEQEAEIMEDKSFYEARFRLQFTEVDEE